MRINIMKDAERFIGIFNDRLALQNSKGEVRIVTLIEDDGIRVDPDREIIIGFGNNEISVGDMDDGIEVTTF